MSAKPLSEGDESSGQVEDAYGLSCSPDLGELSFGQEPALGSGSSRGPMGSGRHPKVTLFY